METSAKSQLPKAKSSQCWALYCLVLFYQATATRLAAVRPLAKFVSIKMVVFFTWWQGVLITVLVREGVLRPMGVGGDGVAMTLEAASLLQNFFICIEMPIMAEGAGGVARPGDP